MDRGVDGKDTEVESYRLRPDQKIFLYFKKDQGKGKFVIDKSRGDNGIDIVHVAKSKVVTHYPHIIGKTYGLSHHDEREYNVLHEQVIEVKNEADAQRLFDDYGFMDVVDEKGDVIKENRWKRDREEADRIKAKSQIDRIDISKLPKHYEEVPLEQFSHSKVRVDGMIRDQRMVENERDDKVIEPTK